MVWTNLIQPAKDRSPTWTLSAKSWNVCSWSESAHMSFYRGVSTRCNQPIVSQIQWWQHYLKLWMTSVRLLILVNLLYMSVAFDMIVILCFQPPYFHIFIRDTVLQWLTSYLGKCSSYGFGESSTTCFEVVVPHASWLRPLLFALYIWPLVMCNVMCNLCPRYTYSQGSHASAMMTC